MKFGGMWEFVCKTGDDLFETTTEDYLLADTDESGEVWLFLADETGDDLFEAATEEVLLGGTDDTGEA